MSTTALEMNCGSPMVGCVCIRKPGAALTSQIAPPVSRTGSVMSGQMKSMPAMSSPTTRAASSAISTFSGCASKVRSIEMPPVDMLPVRVSLTIVWSGGTSVIAKPCSRTSSIAASSTLIRVSTFSWPDTASRVGVGRLDQLLDGVGPVADDVGGHPLGDRRDLAVDDQAAVVLAEDQRLDDHPAASRLSLGDREGGAYVLLVLQVEADASAVVAVERFEDDRVADPSGDRHRLVGGPDRLGAGYRQPGRAEQPAGEVLVARDVDGDRGRVRRHRGADTALVDALPELHERVLVEPDPWDVARDGLVDDRLGGRPERRTLRLDDVRLQLLLEVEVRLRLDEVVDQPYREPPGRDADVLVDVPEDHVVAAVLARAPDGSCRGAGRARPPAVAAGRRAR